MRWAAHRHAQWYLAGLSFAESSFFPVPPDVMLAPMALANTHKAWRFALITTVFSVLGGAAGYAIGMFAFDLVQPLLEKAGYMDKYQLAVDWFKQWGIWVVFLAGFSPIPYKLFTIAAGVVSMAFLPFMVASLIGRGALLGCECTNAFPPRRAGGGTAELGVLVCAREAQQQAGQQKRRAGKEKLEPEGRSHGRQYNAPPGRAQAFSPACRPAGDAPGAAHRRRSRSGRRRSTAPRSRSPAACRP